MTGIKLVSTLGTALVAAALPIASASMTMGASARAEAPLITGRSAHKMRKAKRPSPGSYTNGAPDGANTGSRKQTPTGGNPGDGNHS